MLERLPPGAVVAGMMASLFAWLFAETPSEITVEADDRALLRAAIWGGLQAPDSRRRRCHVRNLTSRGLLRRVSTPRGWRWDLTASGWRSIN